MCILQRLAPTFSGTLLTNKVLLLISKYACLPHRMIHALRETEFNEIAIIRAVSISSVSFKYTSVMVTLC